MIWTLIIRRVDPHFPFYFTLSLPSLMAFINAADVNSVPGCFHLLLGDLFIIFMPISQLQLYRRLFPLSKAVLRGVTGQGCIW